MNRKHVRRDDKQAEVSITKRGVEKEGGGDGHITSPRFLAPGETPWRKESSKGILA